MRATTVGRDHFEKLYAERADPWRYATSGYERAKYAATLASLPRPRYARALDVGCSIGVLTEALARFCDDLLAVEPVTAALDQARQRNIPHSHARFAAMMVPGEWPDERFDLIVISEVLDYLGGPDLLRLADRLRAALVPGGDLLLVHWVAKKGAVRREGEATDLLAASLADTLVPLRAERNGDYRLDLFRRSGGEGQPAVPVAGATFPDPAKAGA